MRQQLGQDKHSQERERKKSFEKGQTLVTLLFFMVIALTITTAAIIIIFVNTQAQTKVQQSQSAYYVAESGMENALMEVIRNPSYAGETMTIGEGTDVISAALSGTTTSGTSTITSTGTVGSFVRKIQVVGLFTNNVFAVQSWKEIF